MRRARARSHPRALGDVLPGFLAGYSPRLELDARVAAAWKKVVGPPASHHASPAGVSNGTLWVVASSHGWAQELSFVREDLRRRLCAALGAEVVTEIRFKVGGVEPPAPPRPKTPAAHDVPEDEHRAIERDLEAVADPELREAIRRARVAHAGRRET